MHIDDINRKMPYDESQDYVKGLIDRSVERAVGSRPVRHGRRMLWQAAAAVALLAIGGTALWHVVEDSKSRPDEVCATGAPLDDFLNNISDEEAAQITYYEAEQIPEL